MNVDETAVQRGPSNVRGYICKTKSSHKQKRPLRFVNKSLLRGTATHVAAISSMSDVQAKLPQVLLLNKRTFPEKATPIAMANGLRFWRDVSAWNTGRKMSQILQLIFDSVSVVKPNAQIVLILDMAPCHLDDDVLTEASKLGVWLCFVPAGLTHLLQPLDVSCLFSYKQVLQGTLLSHEDSSGDVSVGQWCACLERLCKQFWRGRIWRSAFERTGLIVTSDGMSSELKDLRLARTAHDAKVAPTVDAIQSVWPRNRECPYLRLFWLPSKMELELLD